MATQSSDERPFDSRSVTSESQQRSDFCCLAMADAELYFPCRRAGAGLIGLSLSYALSITDILNGVLTTSAETEQEMVSVERVVEYTQLPPQVSGP